MPIRPLDVEVLLDELGTLTVYRLREFDRFLLGFSGCAQPSDSFLKRGVDKNVKRVEARTEIISRSSSPNDAVPLICNVRKDLLYTLPDAVRIHHFQPPGIQAPFKTAAHERFEKPIKSWVSFLFMLLDVTAIAVHPPRDFIRQQLIPQLPTQTGCKFLCDHAASAPVFAIKSNDSDRHRCVLTRRHFPSGARLILFEREGQQEHNRGSHSQDPICIDVGQRSRLTDQRPIKPAICLSRGPRSIQTGNTQTRRETPVGKSEGRLPLRKMSREIDLMKLGAARNQRGYHRCSDACSDIAHEVHESCNAVALLSRHSNVRNQVNGNKQETQAEHLHHA